MASRASSPSPAPQDRALAQQSPRDDDRLAALYSYEVLDTEPEAAYDRLTRLAADLFDVPSSFVTFVDADREWFKSAYGLDVSEIALDAAFGASTIESDGVTVVENAAEHDQYAGAPLVVGDPDIRFYAGAPLTTPNGYRIGTLCVMDTEPRSPAPDLLDRLEDLAATVMESLELRREAAERTQAERRMRRLKNEYETIYENAQNALFVLDVVPTSDGPRFEYQRLNPAYRRITGADPDAETTHTPLTLLGDEAGQIAEQHCRAVVEEQAPIAYEASFPLPSGSTYMKVKLSPVMENGAVDTIVGIADDISERKTLEQRLRESRQKYKSLFDQSHDAILVFSLGGTIQDVNATAVSLFGWSRDEIKGRSLSDLHPPSATDAVHRMLHTLRANQEVHTVVEYRAAGAASFWGELSATQVTVNGETVIRAVIRDVTRERELRQTREQRDLLQAVLDTSPSAITVLNTDGVFTYASPRVEEVLGLPRSKVEGLSYNSPDWNLQEIDGTPLPDRALAFRRVMETGEPVHDVIHTIDPPGADRTVLSVSGAPLRDESGTALGTVLTIRDITSEQQRKALLEQIFNHVPAMLALLDREDRYQFVNDHWETVLGWPKEKLEGQHRDAVLSLLFPTAEERARVRSSMEETTSTWYDIAPEGRDDTRVDTSWTHVTFADGRTLCIGIEIEERKAYEQQLRRAKQAAVEADQLKTSMLANMSHELRTPLTSIIGFSEILIDRLDGRLHDFAERVYQSSTRLMDTLDSVLHLSKLEADTHETETEPVALNGCLERTVRLLAPQADEEDLQLTTRLPEDPVHVEATEDAVHRIAQNLLKNALKFTPSEGTVTARVQPHPSTAQLVVEDTGVGISDAFQQQIFESFTQESNGKDRSYEGSGLGLTITKRLVDTLDGSIDIKSEKGEGTRVTVSLPRTDPSPSSN
jgi:PAS domain S-box-containing protein